MVSRKPIKQQAFLAAYAKTGSLTQAARQAKCHRASHYDWLADPDYADAFQQAQEQAVEGLESEARKRAMRGSDLLLMFLLKSLRPAVYRDNFKGEVNISKPTRVDLSKLTDDQLYQLRTLAKAATEPQGDRSGAVYSTKSHTKKKGPSAKLDQNGAQLAQFSV